jgi:serine/threonine protein phosphatase PrpC
MTRQLHSTANSSTGNTKRGSTKKRYATTALIASATASVSYAGYFFFSSAAIPSVSGESVTEENNVKRTRAVFKEQQSSDPIYGYEFVGFDSYPGIELDDGTGVATAELKAASVRAVITALDATGFDENMRGDKSESTTLNPNHALRLGIGECPTYGCPFLPSDVHYNEETKVALEKLRKKTISEDSKESSLLKTSGSEKAATLTLIGYKGGRMEDQVNQDRAFVLSPFMYRSTTDGTKDQPIARLLGVFDGHARYGERVSEYVVKSLPALLGSKLLTKDELNNQEIGQILQDTFIELDASSPAEPSGGCTATIVLQIDSNIYIANAGDSRSFVAVHITDPISKTGTTQIIYGTREDKPHLSFERLRVEAMGGSVYIPPGGKGTTRVLYQDPTTGSTSGLAMSRSLGDWDAGNVGVVPDPTIAILNIKDMKSKVIEKLNGSCQDKTKEVEIDLATGESSPSSSCATYGENDVKVFSFAATDGLLDYLPENAIATHIAKGLYSTGAGKEAEENIHLLTACEDLIYAAAQGWQEDKGGRYRDDIAISVADLESDS